MKRVLFAVAGILLFGALCAQPIHAQSSAPSGNCDRQCLYGFLDQYLKALAANDASRLPWAKNVKYSENNVLLEPGDGIWGTVTAVGPYDLRAADTLNGQVGFYGVLQETKDWSPFALRLKIEDGKITEAETIVSRNGEGVFPPNPNMVEKPIFNEIVPPELRRPRERMISIADGYFNTLELNDGTLFAPFDPACDRSENGVVMTHNPAATTPNGKLSCGEQFELGYYRWDDRLRARRYFLVDEEKGLVMAGGFIDHRGRLGSYKLADGRTVESSIRKPHSFCFLELFKIRDGKIRQVESVFFSVPYNMPSPWVP